jgi:uncharacterized protein
MRPVRLLAAYFALVFLGGSLLAPWVHALVQELAGSFPGWQSLADEKFHRYVTRSWMILGLLGLWPLARRLGQANPAESGLKPDSSVGRGVATGFAAGFAMLALAVMVTVWFGPREWKPDRSASDWAGHLVNAGLAAIVVGVLEEVVFRGVIFGGLRRSMNWRTALFASSGVYAFLHFFERSEWSGEITWSSGLALLPRMLRGFGDVQALVPGLLNLIVAGGLLALAFQRTGTIWFSIGLHAGWIFWQKTYGFATYDAGGGASWLWGSGKLIDGWVCLPLLLIAVPWVNRLRPTNPPWSDPSSDEPSRQNVA